MKRFFGGATPAVDRIVIGLGNPGDGYANTRHNVGFQAASRLAKRARVEFSVKAAESRIAEGSLGSVRVAIARPQTFMNDSGRAVKKLLDRYRLGPDAIVVVFDEVDLPLGKIRIREAGGPGTHNGMRSIVGAIGDRFPRVRIGIAPQREDAVIDAELAEYVLAPFDPAERALADQMIVKGAEACEVAIRDGIKRAMDLFNG
ncbi:MAG: aminoacyl-tRNA hydrolase [Chloroflexi bacterium]|nr:aminoacyl-tRNA hydrolase [Chloroflexota bacterium]